MQNLEKLGIPRKDIGMLLPLGMETKVVVRANLRNLINLINMSHQRICTRCTEKQSCRKKTKKKQ